MSIWRHPDFVRPDLVLIDGRFRAELEATGMSYDMEVEMIAKAHERRGVLGVVGRGTPEAHGRALVLSLPGLPPCAPHDGPPLGRARLALLRAPQHTGADGRIDAPLGTPGSLVG